MATKTSSGDQTVTQNTVSKQGLIIATFQRLYYVCVRKYIIQYARTLRLHIGNIINMAADNMQLIITLFSQL